VAVAGLSGLGAAVAGYLTYARFTETTVACTTGGCEVVQRSDYAEVAGIPVAVLGLGAYLFLLGTALLRFELVRVAGAVAAVSGALFAAYLLYAQLFLIDAICQWCLVSDVVIGLLALACVLRLRSG
jgi:uncharacterized membrane protein